MITVSVAGRLALNAEEHRQAGHHEVSRALPPTSPSAGEREERAAHFSGSMTHRRSGQLASPSLHALHEAKHNKEHWQHHEAHQEERLRVHLAPRLVWQLVHGICSHAHTVRDQSRCHARVPPAVRLQLRGRLFRAFFSAAHQPDTQRRGAALPARGPPPQGASPHPHPFPTTNPPDTATRTAARRDRPAVTRPRRAKGRAGGQGRATHLQSTRHSRSIDTAGAARAHAAHARGRALVSTARAARPGGCGEFALRGGAGSQAQTTRERGGGGVRGGGAHLARELVPEGLPVAAAHAA